MVKMLARKRRQDRPCLFLMHRDGVWPKGLSNVPNEPVEVSTNQMEVSIKSVDIRQIEDESEANKPRRYLEIEADHWEVMKESLAVAKVISFPLNKFRELNQLFNNFDSFQETAKAKKKRHEKLNYTENIALNYTRKDVDIDIAELVSLSEQKDCLETCFCNIGVPCGGAQDSGAVNPLSAPTRGVSLSAM
uniref:Uncharacterized protein n=1 Tax=Octactis speculum TaxID=3111310 RepID=A0A7S2AUN9_9STRA